MSISAAQQTGLSDEAKERRTFFQEHVIERHNPLIFAFGRPNTKVQMSLKAHIIKNVPIYFGYTQMIFWQLEEESKPFFDATYNPEIFYRMSFHENNTLETDFGLEHLSNGKGGLESRSLNRGYVRLTQTWTPWTDTEVRFGVKVAPAYDFDDTNRDFSDFVGPFEFQGVISLWASEAVTRWNFGARLLPGGKYGHNFRRGGYTLYTSGRLDSIGLVPEFYFEFVDTFAESLLAYQTRQKTFRIGVQF